MLSLPAKLWLRQSRHSALLERFHPRFPTNIPSRPVWVQACSVGEINTALPLIAALRRRWPELPLLLTFSTQTGRARAQAVCDGVPQTWFPFDHPRSVSRFIQELQPRLLLLVETEIWPNVIRHTRRSGAAVAIVNGRLSDKHFARYRRFHWALQDTFAQLSLACMQTEAYAARIASLGAERSRIHVTGNIKFDGVATQVSEDRLRALRAENGLGDAPLLVFGSMRPGDEQLASSCWRRLRDAHPALKLVLAPRHLERADVVAASFTEPLLRRSHVLSGTQPAGERVLLLDTMGELVFFYAAAAVAVVGGSFYPGVEGHNPLEPSALSVPAVFGPYMANFAEPAALLVASGAAVQVSSPESLTDILDGLLRDPAERARMGASAREVVTANQGAIDRTLDLLAGYVGD